MHLTAAIHGLRKNAADDSRNNRTGSGNGNALLDIEALFCALLPERR